MKHRLLAYLIFFVLPILAMQNCTGWNTGSGSVSECFINFPFSFEVANFVYGLVFISAILLFIPLIIYVIIVIVLTEVTLKTNIKKRHE